MEMKIDLEDFRECENFSLFMKIFLMHENPEYREELENADFNVKPLRDQILDLGSNGYVNFESKEDTGTVNRFYIPHPIRKQMYCAFGLPEFHWLQFEKKKLEKEIQELKQQLPESDMEKETQQPVNDIPKKSPDTSLDPFSSLDKFFLSTPGRILIGIALGVLLSRLFVLISRLFFR